MVLFDTVNACYTCLLVSCPVGNRGQGVELYSGRYGNVQECRFFHSTATDDGCGHNRTGNHQATARGCLEVSACVEFTRQTNFYKVLKMLLYTKKVNDSGHFKTLLTRFNISDTKLLTFTHLL